MNESDLLALAEKYGEKDYLSDSEPSDLERYVKVVAEIFSWLGFPTRIDKPHYSGQEIYIINVTGKDEFGARKHTRFEIHRTEEGIHEKVIEDFKAYPIHKSGETSPSNLSSLLEAIHGEVAVNNRRYSIKDIIGFSFDFLDRTESEPEVTPNEEELSINEMLAMARHFYMEEVKRNYEKMKQEERVLCGKY